MKVYLPPCKISDEHVRALIRIHGADIEIHTNTADLDDSYALTDFIIDNGKGFVYVTDPIHVGVASGHRLSFGVLRLDAERNIRKIIHLFDHQHDYVARQIWPPEAQFTINNLAAIH